MTTNKQFDTRVYLFINLFNPEMQNLPICLLCIYIYLYIVIYVFIVYILYVSFDILKKTATAILISLYLLQGRINDIL